ncbi:uncharacterized protein LOC126998580 [Eriocheir sinensis]|uniref:uncharacterized protein LOC126998580 n=1 Tax=Eriocheir sinensis TaxID=95602 RepID=UPI0021C89272|nr:uncharacterized protein LOC126998580 [Eriocheir sinensis]
MAAAGREGGAKGGSFMTPGGARGVLQEGRGGREGINNHVPLILNASLVRPSLMDYLASGFKIRVSHSTPKDSAILPTCGVAVLIVPLPSSSTSSASTSTSTFKEESLDELVERVRAFTRVHVGGVVVLVGAVFGQEEVGGVMCALQIRLLPHPPLLLPAHGEAQAAAHLHLLAKAVGGGRDGVVYRRLAGVVENVLASPVSPYALAGPLGISPAQVATLLRLGGSFSGLACLEQEDVSGAGLPPSILTTLTSALARDTVAL